MADCDLGDNSNRLLKGGIELRQPSHQSLSLPEGCMSFSETGYFRLFTSTDGFSMTTHEDADSFQQQSEFKKGG